MAFALVGYPVVAPNYFRHDPFDQPPHPLLAQILQIVASSQHHAQIATFMATMINENEFKYFNHFFANGKIDNDVMEAAERQAANIIRNAIENTVTTENNTASSSSWLLLDPYMSFGYLDNENEQNQRHKSEPKKDHNNGYECDNDNDDDYADHLPHNNIITDPKQIEKYGYIPYLNYYYYHNDSDQQNNHVDQDYNYIGDNEHCVSDTERAVQHQIDELETVCSSSSYYALSSAAIIEEEVVEEGEEFRAINYKNSIQHDHNIGNEHRKSIPTSSKSLFSGTEGRERRGHYYYDLFSDMPDTRHAELVTKRLNEVTRQRVRIWDEYYASYNGDIPKLNTNHDLNRCSHVSSSTNKISILTFGDEFPELPKRETQGALSSGTINNDNELLQNPPTDYASVVKRNIISKTHSLPKINNAPNNNNNNNSNNYAYNNKNNSINNGIKEQQHQQQQHQYQNHLTHRQQNKMLCYEKTTMHDNDIHFPLSPIQKITTTNIIDNTNNNLCQHKQKQQYLKHMISDSEAAVGQEQVESMTHHFLKSQTITPHTNEAPTITITKTNNSSSTHELNYAAIVKRNTPNYAIVEDAAKRKATSPLQCAPSNKIQKKQENNTTKSSDASRLRENHQEEQVTSIINNDDVNNSNSSNNMEFEKSKIEDYKVNESKSEPDMKKSQDDIGAPQLIPSPPQISDTVPNPGNHLVQERNNDESESHTKPADSPITIVTPYAEIARRNSEKKHLMFLNASGLMGIKSSLLSKFDRLEQQLVRPAVIPWVETGDPLTHLYQKERRQAKEYGFQMDKYFQLSQGYYHQKDWKNAKFYSDKGHYYRERMHELHTRASQRIFEQRNQQDALFIDLHGMHVDEAKASIVRWFQELKSHRGIVYIVTGTGHHSRQGAIATTDSNKVSERKLRPAIREFLNSQYRCEETSVLGDDKGGVFAVYLCPHLYIPNNNISTSTCVYCKFKMMSKKI